MGVNVGMEMRVGWRVWKGAKCQKTIYFSLFNPNVNRLVPKINKCRFANFRSFRILFFAKYNSLKCNAFNNKVLPPYDVRNFLYNS